MNKRVLAYIIISSFFATALLALIFRGLPNEKLEWLHTKGRHIKNESGETVYLRGVAVIELNSFEPFGVSKYWGKSKSSPDENYGSLPNSFNLLNESGVRCVRLSLNWYAWMGIEHSKNIIRPEQADNPACLLHLV